MLTDDPVLYAHPDGTSYVAGVGSDRAWWRWPATANGWAQRQRCSEALAASCAAGRRGEAPRDVAVGDIRGAAPPVVGMIEYDAFHAQLAMRLSGALL